MADEPISSFTDGSVPSDSNFVGGYATAATPGGNRRWSFANIASYVNTKLGLGTMSIQDASAVAITGGAIDGTPIGGDTPSSGVFSSISSSDISFGGGDMDNVVIGAGGADSGDFTTITSTDNITVKTAAKTLILKQGANGKTGTVTLNGITPVTVSNSSITANSGIFFTLKTAHTPGAYPAIATITPTTGFTVAGTVGDVSVYNYHIIESAA